MKQLNHILCGLAMLTALTCAAGNSPAKANKAFQNHGDILSKDMIIDRSKMKKFHYSSDNIKDPREREALRLQMRGEVDYINSPINTARKGDEKLYTVKCVFRGEIEPYFAIYNPNLFIESKYSVWDESEEYDTYYFQVPAGFYDVFAQYYSDAEGMSGWGNLIHEDVEVNKDIVVSFSTDELTEKMVIKPLLKDGQEAILPLYVEGSVDGQLDYTNSTIQYLYFNYRLVCKDCEIFAGGYDMADCIVTGWNDETTFLSNKLSEKYHLIFQYLLEDNDAEIQITTTDIIGCHSGIANNYIKDFKKYPIPTYTNTPLSVTLGIGEYKTAISSILWINDMGYKEGGVYLQSTQPTVYAAIQPDCQLNIMAPVRFINVQGEIIEDSEYLRANMFGLPSLSIEDNWFYVNQNHSTCGNFAYQKPERGPLIEYPGMPNYCFFNDQITQPMGNSSPILVTRCMTYVEGNEKELYFEPQAYIGRYGEVRNCDFWTLHTEVSLNDKQVYNSDSGNNLENWCFENSTNGHEKGIIEATFTNRNVLVDETIMGFNITTMKIDERNEDLCSPTTQMLIFKNSDGAITDRFSKGEEGVIEFSAGDFNWVSEGGYYTCDEADVKVEYAAYGEENFMPLEVEEIPENYFMPGFGYFYRGSLADVTMPTTNGWYDLRFTLTDKAGNEMTQCISPAFKIDTNVSVNAVTIDGIKVWSANGVIYANGTGIASMSLYSTDGKLIATSNGTNLSTDGYRGIGIVKVTDHHGKVSTHKITLR